jgi:4-aminobutyrate aminotransferase-like enzyme
MVKGQILRLLSAYESRNITYIEPDGSWPIVWERARGTQVWDSAGRRYLDLTAGFGVAAAGHANPAVVKAGQRQMAKLLHAMGDVHPHALKAKLARELSRLTFERWARMNFKFQISNFKSTRVRGKCIFCNSGFEAVEAALKTAILATGKRGVLAFQKGYHGLGYGALNATYREHFRAPFQTQLGGFGQSVLFPADLEELADVLDTIDSVLKRNEVGAVLVEPIQGRGGINLPPAEFLPGLRRLCDEHGTLLILDEVFTGFGRTGRWFACEHTRTAPDLICLGKALAGGFPISVCIGRADLMDNAWPASNGEAIHTSTFLGHPVGCVMALAQISEIKRRKLVGRSSRLGAQLLARLDRVVPLAGTNSPALRASARGLGLMAGLEFSLPNGTPASNQVMQLCKRMLRRGFILLPEGDFGNVLSFTPPLTITAEELDRALSALAEEIQSLKAS